MDTDFGEVAGSYTLRWENRSLHCILTVFGIINTDIVTVSVNK